MSHSLPIQPLIVGPLHYTDQFGVVQNDPRKIYFAQGYAGELAGAAFACVRSALYGSALLPVFRQDGSRLVIPGFRGLTCSYDVPHGTLRNFRED